MKKKLSLHARLKSLEHASRGLKDMLRTEPNAWLHTIASVVVLMLAWWLEIKATQFVLIILVIVTVWTTEAINTVLEILTDLVSPHFSDPARRAKDIAAAAVLIASIGAAAVGFMLLGPPLWNRLFSA